MNWYVLDDSGNPVIEPDIVKADAFLRNIEARRVAETIVGDVRVSTVFLALDHAHGDGEPVLWETMVFGGPLDQHQARYRSKADAIAGHADAVNQVEIWNNLRERRVTS